MGASVQGRALLQLLAGALAIGAAPILVRVADVGPTSAAFWRLALALPALALLRRAAARRRAATSRPHRGLMLVAGAMFAADLAVWHQSIHYTTVANATLLANMAPIFVAIGAWLLFGERSSWRFVAGMALALAGSALLAAGSARLSAEHLLGDALGLLTAVFYAGYLLAISRARRSTATLDLMLWTTAISAAVLALLAALAEPQHFWPRSASGWATLCALGWLVHAGGQGLIAHAMAHLPAAFSSVALLVQPVAAALFAWLLLDEAPGWLQAAGGLLVLAGIVVCRRDRPR